MKRLPPFLVLPLLLLAAAPSAGASPTRAAVARSLWLGPQMAGTTPAWLELGSRTYTVRTADRRVLVRGRRSEDRSGVEIFSMSVSGTRTVIGRFLHRSAKAIDIPGPYVIEAASHGAAPSTVYSCPSTLRPGGLDLEANTLVYVDCDRRLKVRDLATGAERTLAALGTAPPLVQVAGPYVAHADPQSLPQEVVVRRLSTGSVVYRAALESDTFGLASDASVYLYGEGRAAADPCDNDLLWRAPGLPTPRVIGNGTCGYPVVATGIRALAPVGAARGQRHLTTFTRSGGRFEIASLGTFGVDTGQIGAAGDTATYALNRCDGRVDVMTVRLTDPDRPRAVSARCSLRFRRGARLRGRRLLARLRCPRGCNGRIAVSARVDGRRRRVGRRRIRFRPSRRTRRVAIRLTRRARRAFAGRRIIRARIRATISDRDGDSRTVRGRLTIRR